MEGAPLKRAIVALVSTILLVALLPGAASAARVTKFSDHHVGGFCEMAVAGGFVTSSIESSATFGDFAQAAVWLDPATPFEDPADASGSTDTVDIAVGADHVDLGASFPVVDAEGSPIGDATLTMSLDFDGSPEIFGDSGKSNHHSTNTGSSQSLAGTGTLTLPTGEIELPECVGDITDQTVKESNPSSFVGSNAGTIMNCFWETPDAVAGLFAVRDSSGTSADSFLTTPNLELFTTDSAVTIDPSGLSADFQLQDATTDDPYTASADATFTPNGTPVKSIVKSGTSRTVVTEQAFIPDGSLQFSTGDSFAIDDEHCDASSFSNHFVNTAPKGPQTGPAPANDTPDGAIALKAGSKLNAQNAGAAIDAEVPITTCPEGDRDDMGRTLWYTVVGTGRPMTFDTAGSGIDTVVAVYVRDGDDFTEIACVDDVFFDPIGTSFQAAVTGDTVEGLTYYIQVGGFRNTLFGDGIPDTGRIRVAVRYAD
jgi:hypothetical protein